MRRGGKSEKGAKGGKRFLLLTIFALLLAGCASVSTETQTESDFHYKMGLSSMDEGQMQTAFVQFQKALQLEPENKDALNSLGLIYLQWGELEKARDLFLKAIAVDHEFSDAYNNLGITYRELGRWQDAIGSFQKALSNPLYQYAEWALYHLGVTYYRS
ncbi:MAG TPA: tetratricopeptide repeat protein, partial [Dissulfurispiraceae bacterium]